MAATVRIGLEEATERGRQGGLHEEFADLRRASARIEHGGAAGRVDLELAP